MTASTERLRTTPETKLLLGRVLSAAMAHAGLGPKTVGDHLGFEYTTVCNWKAGERETPIEALLWVARQVPTSRLAALVTIAVRDALELPGRWVMPPSPATTGELLGHVLDVTTAVGTVAAEVRAAQADGEIDPGEAARIQAAADRLAHIAAQLRESAHALPIPTARQRSA